ncbi:uncharacterized protein [Montipora capricornis]|uniref:uncharacterized protein isoform X1 n=1 Tax=Montipora capricornis TaxID=246305 RepID=UPI0035F21679
MDVPKTAFFLLITLFSVAVISNASEGQTGIGIKNFHRNLSYIVDSVKGPKDEIGDKITTIEKMLDEVSVVGIKKYQRGFDYVADSVEGPKDEMRDKIIKIKKLLNEVSDLAEICGACDSNPCLNGGKCIDMKNGKYRCVCAVGWKGDQCEKCNMALGMESGKIKDDQITASSSESEHPASRGRLNYKLPSGEVGSWSSRLKDNMQWFQVDLGSGNRNVSGIATQGGTDYRGRPRWVEKYKLMYSDDGVNFQYYNDGGATKKVFIANKNRDKVVYNELSQPITSRYIRIRPMKGKKKWNWFSMRVELYGCQEIRPCDSSPCFNGGNCTNEADGNFTCHCESGWTGETCQLRRNCAELYKSGERSSGVYTIDPDGSGAFDVFCDQTTAGGGWTVFQKRLDGSVSFYRGWSDYKVGFGNLNGEYWLGLDKIHRLTKLVKNTLRVDLEDTEGKTAYAAYDMFAVSSEKTNYQLSLGTYSGTAGDSLSEHRGAAFSTKDNDNDQSSNTACAVYYKGAWWYVACYVGGSTLNGLYYHDDQSPRGDGVIWSTWRGYYYSLKKAEMKIRPVGF